MRRRTRDDLNREFTPRDTNNGEAKEAVGRSAFL